MTTLVPRLFDQSSTYALLKSVPVTDVGMNYFVNDNDSYDVLARHLNLSMPDSKGHPALLYYGLPGQGKTRFFREVMRALNQQNGYDTAVLAKLRGANITEDWIVARLRASL